MTADLPDMWINAMSIIRPSEETLTGIGRDVVHLLLGSRDRADKLPGDPLCDLTIRIVAS